MADALFRYIHAPPAPDEAEAAAYETLGGALEGARGGELEQQFVAAHTQYVRAECVRRLRALDAAPDLTPRAFLDAVLACWDDVAYPARMARLFAGRAGVRDACAVAFAAVVRACADTDWLVQRLSAESIDQGVQRRLRACGLALEASRVLARQIPAAIDAHVARAHADTYCAGCLGAVQRWVDAFFAREVQPALAPGRDAELTRLRMRALAGRALARLRIRELFRIVETENALGLADLQETTTTPALRQELVHKFLGECDQTLLSGAVDTAELVRSYLCTVQAFAVLDPTGVLLERVAQHVRPRLVERSDTPREIALGMFGSAESPLRFLSDQLLSKAPLQKAHVVREAFRRWVPDPIDTPANFVRRQSQDAVQTLLDLYENKDVFVKQFAVLFRDEFLPELDAARAAPAPGLRGDPGAKLARLEAYYAALVSRFGEQDMARIRVMLQDVRASVDAGAACLVLSKHYWPALSGARALASDALPWPAAATAQLPALEAGFRGAAAAQGIGLRWLPDYFFTSLTLELADRTLELVVSAEQAQVVALFDEVAALTAAQVCEQSGLARERVDAALAFWCRSQVLACDGDEEYRVVETLPAAATAAQAAGAAGEPHAGAEQLRASMQVYWSFIVGMLTNLGALPVERIHSFLAFVPSDDPFVQTKQELENYLLAMVDEGKLLHDKAAATFSLP